MSDNRNKQGKQDRDQIANNQRYEMRYIADKLNVSVNMVQKAIDEVGNNRQDIEQFITNLRSK